MNDIDNFVSKANSTYIYNYFVSKAKATKVFVPAQKIIQGCTVCLTTFLTLVPLSQDRLCL